MVAKKAIMSGSLSTHTNLDRPNHTMERTAGSFGSSLSMKFHPRPAATRFLHTFAISLPDDETEDMTLREARFYPLGSGGWHVEGNEVVYTPRS